MDCKVYGSYLLIDSGNGHHWGSQPQAGFDAIGTAPPNDDFPLHSVGFDLDPIYLCCMSPFVREKGSLATVNSILDQFPLVQLLILLILRRHYEVAEPC